MLSTDSPFVQVEMLPSNLNVATIHVAEYELMLYVHVTAYLENQGVIEFRQKPSGSRYDYDEFWRDNCRNCKYKNLPSMSQVRAVLDDALTDADMGHVELDEFSFQSACAYVNSNDNDDMEHCPEGHELSDYAESLSDEPEEVFEPPAMAFRISTKYTAAREGSSAYRYLSAAWLQHGYYDVEDRAFYGTAQYRTLNTYNRSSHEICWGDNRQPRSLAEACHTFFSSYANDDLLSQSALEDNIEDLQSDMDAGNYELLCLSDGLLQEHQIAFQLEENPLPCNAMIFAAHGTAGFMQLSASGAKVAKSVCGKAAVTAIPAFRYTVRLSDTQSVEGLVTWPVLDGNTSWFVSHDGRLLGQLPTPTDLPQCDSTTPSSSEPAEPAATSSLPSPV